MSNVINLSTVLSAGVLAIVASLTACNTAPEVTQPINTPESRISTTSNENLPLVVATSTVLCDLTKQIAGETINLKCLIEPGLDPHVYEAKPDDRKAIDSAQLILYGGYNFEPSLIKLIQASSNASAKVAINEVAITNPLIGEHEHSHDEKSEKESKSKKEVDPHVWNSARNGIKIAQATSKSLITLRPDKAEFYNLNTTKLVNELEQIDTWILAQISTIPENSRKLITTHDALGYYADAYNISIDGALGGISTEEKPTANRIKELVEVIKVNKVPTIFAEVTLNPKLISAVAKEAGVKVSERELYADGLGSKGTDGETYTGMLISNTRTIVEGLGGKYTPFVAK